MDPTLLNPGAAMPAYHRVEGLKNVDARYRGRPVLTISDDDPGCSFGAMFCLRARANKVSFSVNLDAIGRGPLRIDPRVLKIGSDDEGGAR